MGVQKDTNTDSAENASRPADAPVSRWTASNEQLERYSRHIILKEIGVKGQKKLLNSKVLIIGAGGLGAPAAMYLAAAGVGTIGIADADEVDLSNLQRQIIHSTEDLGKAKVLSAKETMNRMNPDVQVNTYRTFVSAENIMDLIRDYDFIIDGTDNFPAKFLINDACVMGRKPFSHAGIIRFKGQLMTYVPGEGPCYRCVFKNPPPKDAVPTCKQAGVIGAMGGVIGSLQAMEAIKYITGAEDLLTGYLLTFDAIKMEFRKIRLPKPDGSCAVCGAHPTITELIDYEQTECEGI
ncbi:MAG: molybdopterin-synthase adenylyltransferase MoeB [Lachnospiraceae bacterium]|nr:molybdopterin-synthase adenylyltransferase MoeB [Lachnospiraceae bacterium]